MWQYTDKLKLPGIGVALDGNYCLRSEAELLAMANKTAEIVPEPVNLSGEKNFCDYCKGYTIDDSRGNCSACGAPRNPITSEAYKRALVIFKKSREEGMNSWSWWARK